MNQSSDTPPTPVQQASHVSLEAAGRAASINDEGPVRLLLVSPRAEWRESVKRSLSRAGMSCAGVGTLAAAEQRIGAWSSAGGGPCAAAFDVVLAETALSDGRGVELAPLTGVGGMSLVLAGSGLNLDDAVNAMRAGAADIVPEDLRGGELIERIATAAARAREGRRQRGRIVKLKRMCRRLNTAREQVARQVDTLCTDLVQAYQELADHMNQVTTATEFKGLIRNELDIESLLRTTLEFVLSRSGPTNAAIFLPTTSGDYSLGAYVNYDCPRDTVDILLDQLANVVAPRFENARGLVLLTDRDELDRYVGDEAQWLEGSGVAAMACRHGGETLAVFMLFRDRRNPYGTPLLEQVKTIGELFATQLARVIHIHHRHLPKDKWGMLGDPEHGADGYDDLAA